MGDLLQLLQVVTNLDRWQNVAGYAAGIAIGVYIGVAMSKIVVNGR